MSEELLNEISLKYKPIKDFLQDYSGFNEEERRERARLIQALCDLEIDVYNANYSLAKAKEHIKQLEDDRFWQAFCASLNGHRANPLYTDTDTAGNSHMDGSSATVAAAIADAQEAVRQVGELNKIKSEVLGKCDELDRLTNCKHEPDSSKGISLEGIKKTYYCLHCDRRITQWNKEQADE